MSDPSGPPPRPDNGEDVLPILKPPRGRTSPWIVVLIVVCSILFVGMIAAVVVASVDRQGTLIEDQFKQVQYCLDHPKDPACRPGTPSP